MEKWGTWEFSPKLHDKLEELASIPGNCPENSEWALLFNSANVFTMSEQVLDKNQEEDAQIVYDTDDNFRMTECSQHASQRTPITKDKDDSQVNDDLLENGSVISVEWLSSLTDRQAELVFSQLSDESAGHVISTVCATGKAMLATLLCTKFLLPYILRNQNIDDTIVGDLQRFAASFSGIACTSLFVPLMTGPEFDTISLQAVMKSFSPQLMSTFLGCFLDRMGGCGSLHEWQLPVLCLFSSLFGDSMFAARLVHLLATSRGKLTGSTVYGQLVMEVASSLEADTPPMVVAEIVEIIENLETVYKNLAMFAIKDTFLLSQE